MGTLRINYKSHDSVEKLVDILTYCLEGISLDFDGWDDEHPKGPGLYFAIVVDSEYDAYADPMGANEWPVDNCRRVRLDDEFYETARGVAMQKDGAVIVSVDGYIEEQMVRLRNLDPEETAGEATVEYEEWMGSRHMSAIETSVREPVVATITLSEETGRVSKFEDGSMQTQQRGELGGMWQRNG